MPSSPPAGNESSPTLLLLVALAAEATALERVCRHQQAMARAVRIIRCGIGCDAVLKAAEQQVTAAGLVGSIGVSGGLAPDLAPGEVILGERICSQVSGLEPDHDCTPGLVDLLQEILEKAAIPCRRGILLCAGDPLLTTADKLAAHRQTGALAVDMESAAAAHAAHAAKRPFFCLRVICDPARRALAPELLRGVDSRGDSRPLRLLPILARRPWLLGPLLVMARDFTLASSRMEQAWQAVCAPLASRCLSGLDRAGPP